MHYLVSGEQMRRVDRNTIEKIGMPEMVLMERAALAVREQVVEYQKSHSEMKVLIMAGYGNNGADGLALARLLKDYNIEAAIWCVGDEKKASESFRKQKKILANYGMQTSAEQPAGKYDVYVDCLFGTGLARTITGEYAAAIEWFNEAKGFKISVDVPSGLNSDDGKPLGVAVYADITVTLGFCKKGLMTASGREYAGKVIVSDIGIPMIAFGEEKPVCFTYDEPVQDLMPKRNRKGNKGSFGKVVVVAGSYNMAGAAVLCAKAAYRAGAGMVKVITPEENRVIVQTKVPEALLGTDEDLYEALQWGSVCVIGPGLGKSESAKKMLRMVLGECDLPLVIDADALNLIAEEEELRSLIRNQKKERDMILTPHPGELARLRNCSVADCVEQLSENAIALAQELSIVVVAKDAVTYVCEYELPYYVNSSGNSGMGTAGSGDVLAGFIGGLLGQNMESFKAACVGVYLHGKVGDYLQTMIGEHQLMAEDLTGIPLDILSN